MTFYFLLRILALLLFTGRVVYWQVTEKKADSAKPKIQPPSLQTKIERRIIGLMGLIIILQLLGLQLFSFEVNTLTSVLGLLFVIVGISCSIKARKDLGTNWAHAAEYQIKKDHELVTSGIYKYIRHPIYSGLMFSFIGAELIVGSYIIVLLLVLLPLGAYTQAKREEKILLSHFEKKYETYMKKSKMFVPYIW